MRPTHVNFHGISPQLLIWRFLQMRDPPPKKKCLVSRGKSVKMDEFRNTHILGNIQCLYFRVLESLSPAIPTDWVSESHGPGPKNTYDCAVDLTTITGWWLSPTPLKYMKVSWDENSQYMENKKCSKPPTRQLLAQISCGCFPSRWNPIDNRAVANMNH